MQQIVKAETTKIPVASDSEVGNNCKLNAEHDDIISGLSVKR